VVLDADDFELDMIEVLAAEKLPMGVGEGGLEVVQCSLEDLLGGHSNLIFDDDDVGHGGGKQLVMEK